MPGRYDRDRSIAQLLHHYLRNLKVESFKPRSTPARAGPCRPKLHEGYRLSTSGHEWAVLPPPSPFPFRLLKHHIRRSRQPITFCAEIIVEDLWRHLLVKDFCFKQLEQHSRGITLLLFGNLERMHVLCLGVLKESWIPFVIRSVVQLLTVGFSYSDQ